MPDAGRGTSRNKHTCATCEGPCQRCLDFAREQAGRGLSRSEASTHAPDVSALPDAASGRTLSEPTIAAIKAALQASLREVGAARHDYAPIHDFQRALDEIDAMTTPARKSSRSDAAGERL